MYVESPFCIYLETAQTLIRTTVMDFVRRLLGKAVTDAMK